METKQEVFNELLKEYEQTLSDALSECCARITDEELFERYCKPFKERYEKAEQ